MPTAVYEWLTPSFRTPILPPLPTLTAPNILSNSADLIKFSSDTQTRGIVRYLNRAADASSEANTKHTTRTPYAAIALVHPSTVSDHIVDFLLNEQSASSPMVTQLLYSRIVEYVRYGFLRAFFDIVPVNDLIRAVGAESSPTATIRYYRQSIKSKVLAACDKSASVFTARLFGDAVTQRFNSWLLTLGVVPYTFVPRSCFEADTYALHDCSVFYNNPDHYRHPDRRGGGGGGVAAAAARGSSSGKLSSVAAILERTFRAAEYRFVADADPLVPFIPPFDMTQLYYWRSRSVCEAVALQLDGTPTINLYRADTLSCLGGRVHFDSPFAKLLRQSIALYNYDELHFNAARSLSSFYGVVTRANTAADLVLGHDQRARSVVNRSLVALDTLQTMAEPGERDRDNINPALANVSTLNEVRRRFPYQGHATGIGGAPTIAGDILASAYPVDPLRTALTQAGDGSSMRLKEIARHMYRELADIVKTSKTVAKLKLTLDRERAETGVREEDADTLAGNWRRFYLEFRKRTLSGFDYTSESLPAVYIAKPTQDTVNWTFECNRRLLNPRVRTQGTSRQLPAERGEFAYPDLADDAKVFNVYQPLITPTDVQHVRLSENCEALTTAFVGRRPVFNAQKIQTGYRRMRNATGTCVSNLWNLYIRATERGPERERIYGYTSGYVDDDRDVESATCNSDYDALMLTHVLGVWFEERLIEYEWDRRYDRFVRLNNQKMQFDQQLWDTTLVDSVRLKPPPTVGDDPRPPTVDIGSAGSAAAPPTSTNPTPAVAIPPRIPFGQGHKRPHSFDNDS